MTRAALYHLVDELTDSQIDRAAYILDAVRRNDRVAMQLAVASEVTADDDEAAALDELSGVDREQTHSFEEVLAHFHMSPDQLR